MNIYIKNILVIILITILTLILMSTWLDLDFGYVHILFIIGISYAVYLNVKELKKEQRKT